MNTTTVIAIICILVSYFLMQPERKTYETHVIKKAVESAQDEDIDIYIDGEPVSDNFDINGIDLHDYTIKIENNTLYLISK